MLTIDVGDSNVAINITPVDSTGAAIGLTGATNPVYIIETTDGANRKAVTPSIDATHTFFQYTTVGTEFPAVGFYQIQPQWTDSSGGHRSAAVVLVSAEPRL